MKHTKHLLSSLFVAALVLGGWVSAQAQTEITLRAPLPMKESFDKLIPQFEMKTGDKVTATYGTNESGLRSILAQAKVVAQHFSDLPYANTLANVQATYETVDYSLVMPAAAVTANIELAKDSAEIPASASVPQQDVFDPSYLNAVGAGS